MPRLGTRLDKEQVEFLDRLSRESKFTGGAKLSRSSIIRALTECAMRLEIDLSGVKTEADLERKIYEAICKCRNL